MPRAALPSPHRLRPATPADVRAVADVYLGARAASVPAIPPGVHSDEEVRTWISTTLYGNTQRHADHELWVAVSAGSTGGSANDVADPANGTAGPTGGSANDVAGRANGVADPANGVAAPAEDHEEILAFMALAAGWIAHLYVSPGRTGRGIGTALVALAKRRRPGGLELWTFESNSGARRFYERHGFVPVDRTDGDNEEGAPDIRYRWGPATTSPGGASPATQPSPTRPAPSV